MKKLNMLQVASTLQPNASQTCPGSRALPTSLVCNSVHARLEFALQGHGIACLPDASIRRELAAGALRPLLGSEHGEETPLRLLWPSSRGAPARLQAWLAFIGRWQSVDK
ncbi:LysR substrate-binding domain-containing protein [Chromobacterium phragmitis]|nr:LysR substrate-binding domain-containing protein [Chromobacterium phragmitis]